MSEPFTLQAHLTDACQLQCRHCYRDERKTSLPRVTWERVVDDLADFCDRRQIVGRLTLAGGEPLLRYDDALTLTRRARDRGLQVHLLTNGLLLDPIRASELKAAGCLRVQVSVDGHRVAHESVRGAGTFAGALAALTMLRDAELPSTISMTLGEWNRADLPAVAELARLHQSRLFVSRFVPCGMGTPWKSRALPAARWRSAMRACSRWQRNHAPGVALRDPLYLCFGYRRPSADRVGCAIGYNGLAVDADGVAYPCRRLPLPLGNLAEEGLEAIWRKPLLESLRDRDQLRGACGACARRWQCGGCRAIAHATNGDAWGEDPDCWRNTRWARWLSGRWPACATRQRGRPRPDGAAAAA